MARCELSLLLLFFLLCSERFFSGFPLSSKTNISKFQFDRMQDNHNPLSCCKRVADAYIREDTT